MTHTPGPWFISRDPRPDMWWNNHIASQSDPNSEICSMFHTKDIDDNETGEANARLIAAAPSMFDALEKIAKGWPGTEASQIAIHAIAKAKGESHE